MGVRADRASEPAMQQLAALLCSSCTGRGSAVSVVVTHCGGQSNFSPYMPVDQARAAPFTKQRMVLWSPPRPGRKRDGL